ncbi:serine/threonine-protein kinase [Nocardioides pyridinolyticus]
MDRVGPYRIVRRLGSGGMGVVHEAWDTALERPVALKVISPQLADDPGFRGRFTREARLQAALSSEHVLPVYAFGEDDGRLWIASPYVPDGDLGRLLKQYGAPPRPVAIDLIDQVAAGLADAHAAGLVHRDIKPANVLLRRGPRIRAYLADFGVAGPIGSVHDEAGTPAYMAPELTAGGAAGVGSDVYALGCLLRAVLAPGDSLQSVVAVATAERPDDRYSSAAAFREALTATAPRRRRWWLVAVPMAILLLVVAAAGAWVVWREPDPEPSGPAVDVERRAADELAASLERVMTPAQADCAAAYLLDDLGFAALVDAGFFARDGAFLDPDLADEPEVKRSLTAATAACA